CLTIEFPFAGDYNVGSSDLFFQFDYVGNDVEAWSQLPTAKTHQAKTETAGRARAGIISKIATQLARHSIGSPREGALQDFELVRGCPFLRTDSTRRAIFAEQRILYIASRN